MTFRAGPPSIHHSRDGGRQERFPGCYWLLGVRSKRPVVAILPKTNAPQRKIAASAYPGSPVRPIAGNSKATPIARHTRYENPASHRNVGRANSVLGSFTIVASPVSNEPAHVPRRLVGR